MARMAVIVPLAPRLLLLKEAAAYLRMGESQFRRVCPVTAKRVAPGERGLRWDRTELDRWIDGLDAAPAPGAPSGKAQPTSAEDWLERFGDGEGARRGP
jgi:predicted DNA-binding transcriptional regulator AlpA